MWVKPVVPGERKLEKTALMLGSLADVMDNPGCVATIRRWNHDGDVRQPACHGAGDEITRQIIRSLLRDRECGATPLEEGLQIGHTAVINVFVR